MNQTQRNLAKLGRSYWHEYVRVNGYAFEPKADGISKLARLLDLTPKHTRLAIRAYLNT